MLVDQRVEALLNSTTPPFHLGWKLIDQPWYWIDIQPWGIPHPWVYIYHLHGLKNWWESWLPNFETNLLILEEWHDHPGNPNGSQKSSTLIIQTLSATKTNPSLGYSHLDVLANRSNMVVFYGIGCPRLEHGLIRMIFRLEPHFCSGYSHGLSLNYSHMFPWFSQHVPLFSQHVPWFSQHFPWFSQHVPWFSQHVPWFSQHFPWFSQHVPWCS